MDLVGRDAGGGVLLQRGGVVVRPVLQPPDPGVVHGVGTPAFQQFDLPLQSRQHRILVDPARLAAPVARQAPGPGPAHQRAHQGRGLRRCAADLAHLDQRLVDDEVRRDHAQGLIAARDLALLVHLPAERLHARQIGVRVPLVLDDMLGVQEVRRGLVGTAQLADHIGLARAHGAVFEQAGVGELAGRLVLEGGDVLDGVVVDGVHARQGASVDGVQALQVLGVDRLVLVQGRRGEVRQGRPGPRQVTDVDPQPGGVLGRATQVALGDDLQDCVEPGRFGRIGPGQRERGGRLGQGA